jgi:hypothetical protein
MEKMIGEIFRSDHLDSMMITLETDKTDCTGCDYFLHGGRCIKEEHGYCSSHFRTDKKNVIFKETEEILDIKHDVRKIGLDKEEEQAFMKIINLLYLKK